MRAILLATAVAARLWPRAAWRESAQAWRRSGDFLRCAALRTERAPWMRRVRLPEEAAKSVDAGGSLGDPSGANAVERAQGLLGDGLHRDGADLVVSVGLEHAPGVGAVGLVAADVGPDGVRGEEDRGVAKIQHAASPEVGRAAGLHDDGGLGRLGEELGELSAGGRRSFDT
jgi:hypothetical protein